MSSLAQYQQPNARELTDEERADRAEVVHRIQNDILDARHRGIRALWDLARSVSEFHEQSGWTALGYASLKHWLAQAEINMTGAEYFRLLRRYRTLVLRRGIDVDSLVGLYPSKVDIVLPAIEAHKVPVEDALEDAKSMGARDLREQYKGRQPDVPAPAEGPELTPFEQVEAEVSPETANRRKRLNEAALRVDSWLTIGGDRRKAQRAWQIVLEHHPLLCALRDIEVCIGGQDGAPSREECAALWSEACEVLALSVEGV